MTSSDTSGTTMDTSATDTAAMSTTGSTSTMTTSTTATTGTTATTTSSLTPEEQLTIEIDQRFQKLNPGELLISGPHEMRVATPEPFILRIASKGQSDGIGSGLPSGGQTSMSELHVTPTMRAELTGTGFTILKTSDERQIIGGGSFTEWSWQVTPTESGNRELVATVYVELDSRSKGFPKRWPVHVSADIGQSLSHFLASNWQWLSSTLLIPLVVFFWRQRKKQT
ncbi:MAG: hypothetical protein JO088_19375 [Acidobacteria bacterium]|nr:hypothetical protein [Acidobacteriota bacterium]